MRPESRRLSSMRRHVRGHEQMTSPHTHGQSVQVLPSTYGRPGSDRVVTPQKKMEDYLPQYPDSPNDLIEAMKKNRGLSVNAPFVRGAKTFSMISRERKGGQEKVMAPTTNGFLGSENHFTVPQSQ